MAIVGFKDSRLRRLFEERVVPQRFPADLARVTQRKLDALHSAPTLADCADLPGTRLEALHGDRAGQHSIRVNRQFRLCFVWTDAGPDDLEFVDYH